MTEFKILDEILENYLERIRLIVRTAVREEMSLFNTQLQPAGANDEGYLTTEQAAVFLKRKISTIYKDVRLGNIPHHRSGSRKLLFSRKELEQYVQDRKGFDRQAIEEAVSQFALKKYNKQKFR